MPSNGLPIQSLALEPAIDPHFLAVKPEVNLIEVLAMMSRVRSSCSLSCGLAPESDAQFLEAVLPQEVSEGEALLSSQSLADCVLVMSGSELLGVFTERDIVSLTAQGRTLSGLAIADVITQPVITLQYSPTQDIFTALSILRQHSIRHLPIVNEQNQPIGLVTQQSIRRALQPMNLLTRFRYVKDVMKTVVIHAPTTASVLDLARLMTQHQVSCIVITETDKDHLKPVGIVTERDLVQFQALELDLARTQAKTVMSAPLFCLSPEDPLWLAHQTMSEQWVRRLVIIGEFGELLGIVSQTSLLQVLSPADMYGVIEVLQQVVDERTKELEQTNEQLRQEILERKKAELALQSAHDELKDKVEERTQQLVEANARLREDIERREQIEAALRDSEQQLRSQTQELQQAFNELQQTQLKLIQSEKMSSLGQLVAGIAHEINNPTNFIYGNLTYAEEYVKGMLELLTLYGDYYARPAPEIQKKLQEVDLAFIKSDLVKLLASMKLGAERIRNLILSLRNFSRLDEAQLKAVNIHEGLESTLVILQNQLKTRGGQFGIEIIKEYSDLPTIKCAPGQLNQVFLNIITNAIDALEEKTNHDLIEPSSAETLTLIDELPTEVSDFPMSTPSKPTIRIQTYISPDEDSLIIRIADNGTGMDEEIRKRIFDPFFTTKPVGQGTGLGLAISYQIVVDKHQGHLECYSTPGQGTEFVIKLPKQQQTQSNLSLLVPTSNRVSP